MKAQSLPDLDPTKGYLMSLTLENIRCFGDPAETLYMTKLGDPTKPARWTVILGANGVGKTTVLRALATYYEVQFLSIIDTSKCFQRTSEFDGYFEATDSRKYSFKMMHDGTDFAPGDTWTGPKLKAKLTEYIRPIVVAYGAGRAWRGEGDTSFSGLETIFDREAQVRDPSEMLFRYDYREKSETLDRPSRFQAFKNALTKGILPDVTDLRMGFAANDRPTIEFQTPDGWIALDDMSWGYQVFAAFAADYASRLIEWYPDSASPLHEPGICLVDELDLHMHPSWQRKVIDDLSRIFPATQFIVTVHSPLVVQAAEDANLVVLKRYPEDPSRVMIDNDVEAIKGWRIDQVLTSDLFGLDSARPPSVQNALVEVQRLKLKAKLTKAEKIQITQLEAEARNALSSEDWNWKAEQAMARAAAERAAE
jgi:predicted ATP-binding protein involved in virulence